MKFKIVAFVKYSLKTDISERKLQKLRNSNAEIAITQLTQDKSDDKLAQRLIGWKLETVWFLDKDDVPTTSSIYSELQFYALGQGVSPQEADPCNLLPEADTNYETTFTPLEQELEFWKQIVLANYDNGIDQDESLFNWKSLQEFKELHSFGMAGALYLDNVDLHTEKYTALESLYGDGFASRMVGSKFSKYPYSDFEDQEGKTISVPPGILLAVPLVDSQDGSGASGFISSKMHNKRHRTKSLGLPLVETSSQYVQITLPKTRRKSRNNDVEFMKILRKAKGTLLPENSDIPKEPLRVYLLINGKMEDTDELDYRLAELLTRKRAFEQQHRDFMSHTLSVGSSSVDAFECTICGNPKVIRKIVFPSREILMVCSQDCNLVLNELCEIATGNKQKKRTLASITDKITFRANDINLKEFSQLRLLLVKRALGKSTPEDLGRLNSIRSNRPKYQNASAMTKQMYSTTFSPTFPASQTSWTFANSGVFLVNNAPSQVVSFQDHPQQSLSRQQTREFGKIIKNNHLVDVWKLQ